MALTTNQSVLDQDFNQISSTQQGILGTQAFTKDGRRFRYASAGASTLAPGKMNQAPAIVAAHVDFAGGTATAIGDTKITLLIPTTSITAGQYAGGYVWSSSTSTGQGVTYSIRSHGAVTLATTGVFYLDDPIQVAGTTTTKYTLFPNLHNSTIVVPSAATAGQVPVGVSQVSITNAYFGWLQVGGPASLLSDATVYTLGEEVSQAASGVAGSGSLKVATFPTYGDANQLGVSGQYNLVNLRLN